MSLAEKVLKPELRTSDPPLNEWLIERFGKEHTEKFWRKWQGISGYHEASIFKAAEEAGFVIPPDELTAWLTLQLMTR